MLMDGIREIARSLDAAEACPSQCPKLEYVQQEASRAQLVTPLMDPHFSSLHRSFKESEICDGLFPCVRNQQRRVRAARYDINQ